MTRFLVALLVIFLTIPAHSQSVAEIVKPAHDMSVPSAIRDHLSEIADVEAFTPLPNQDVVIVYDTVRWYDSDKLQFMDNHPHIAILTAGSVTLDLDVLSLAQGGPVIFKGMAILRRREPNAVAVFAFSSAVDGSTKGLSRTGNLCYSGGVFPNGTFPSWRTGTRAKTQA